MPHSSIPRSLRVALIVASVALTVASTGCTDDSAWQSDAGSLSRAKDTTSQSSTESKNEAETSSPGSPNDTNPRSTPVVVASTSWSAAFVRAAGVRTVTLIAPVNAPHPPDYDPRPSDLAALADADFVVLGGFEGFAPRMTEAAGSGAEVVTIKIDNSPETIRSQVRLLAEKFGTTRMAELWIARFDRRVERFQEQIAEVRPTPTPSVVAHTFMAPWVTFAGLELVATYGPKPVTAAQLAEFTDLAPTMIFDNAHVQIGDALADLDSERIKLVNFPSDSLDLIEVFDTNTRTIIKALKTL